MAGFATQFGMLVEPIANAFNANVNEVASIFSLLNGGALAGTIAAFFLIEKVGIKRMTVLCYGIIALSSLGLYTAPSLSIVMFMYDYHWLLWRCWSVYRWYYCRFTMERQNSEHNVSGTRRDI